jgi:hypothetical protein
MLLCYVVMLCLVNVMLYYIDVILMLCYVNVILISCYVMYLTLKMFVAVTCFG